MDLGISGRRAAVAAASGGLGFATAAALVGDGVSVAICSRSRERVDAAAARLAAISGSDSGRVVGLVHDVGRPEGAAAFVEAAIEALGGIDILVTNAGGPPPGNFASTPIEAYPDAIDLNLMSVVAMCKAAVPAMQARGWGRVLAITSISVRQPIANLILSNTARAGATAFLKTLALEVARDGVTVNSLQPGLHATDRIAKLYGDSVAEIGAGVPVGHVGDPGDFGRIAAFVCSEHASFLTGTHIPVDGGSYLGLL